MVESPHQDRIESHEQAPQRKNLIKRVREMLTVLKGRISFNAPRVGEHASMDEEAELFGEPKTVGEHASMDEEAGLFGE